MEISFIHTQVLVHLHVNKTNFHRKGFAPGLALKQRRNATYCDCNSRRTFDETCHETGASTGRMREQTLSLSVGQTNYMLCCGERANTVPRFIQWASSGANE